MEKLLHLTILTVALGETAKLNVTIGDSVLIPCSAQENINWFYWQEDNSSKYLFHWHDGHKQPSEEYINRSEAFDSEINSGNVSVRLLNVTAADDLKSFWVMVGYNDGKLGCQHCCNSTLQVSALYKDMNLIIDASASTATCSARGGYPESSMSWSGQNQTSGAHVRLQGVNASSEKDLKVRTFTVTSSVSVRGLKSVTCCISNTHICENKTIETPKEPDDQNKLWTILIVVGVVVAVGGGVFFYRKRRNGGSGRNNGQIRGPSGGGNEAEVPFRNLPVADQPQEHGNNNEAQQPLQQAALGPQDSENQDSGGEEGSSDCTPRPQESENQDSGGEEGSSDCTPSLLTFVTVTVSSETNGTKGAPLVLQCHHELTQAFTSDSISIYWQSKSGTVLHVYAKGKEESTYQTQSFRHRTAIFPDQLALGNFSLVIDPLMLKDDQLSVEVVLLPESKKLCPTTIHVAAHFEEPSIEIHHADMTATCRTKGGFPKPEFSWICTDHEGHERTLEPPDVQMPEIHEETNGTYSAVSKINITGSKTITCRVHNPTSNQTLSATKEVAPSRALSAGPNWVIRVTIIFLDFVLIGVIYCFIECRNCGWGPRIFLPAGSAG